MTQIIVPTDTPGVNIVRGIEVWGRASDHCEIIYDERARARREPARPDRLGPPGRAGPARRRPRLPLHELDRPDVAGLRPDGAARRRARGARREARDQAVHAGLHRGLLHRHPGRAAHDDPLRRAHGQRRSTRARTSRRSRSSCPRPITAWWTARSRSGARPGVSGDLPLAAMYQGARTLRLADGPDEVHKILIAKNVLKRYHAGESLGLRELTSGPPSDRRSGVAPFSARSPDCASPAVRAALREARAERHSPAPLGSDEG